MKFGLHNQNPFINFALLFVKATSPSSQTVSRHQVEILGLPFPKRSPSLWLFEIFIHVNSVIQKLSSTPPWRLNGSYFFYQ
jgi:hypothetical protein